MTSGFAATAPVSVALVKSFAGLESGRAFVAPPSVSEAYCCNLRSDAIGCGVRPNVATIGSVYFVDFTLFYLSCFVY